MSHLNTNTDASWSWTSAIGARREAALAQHTSTKLISNDYRNQQERDATQTHLRLDHTNPNESKRLQLIGMNSSIEKS